MAYFKRRRFGRRKFRDLERVQEPRIITFIPRRMDLIPDGVRVKLPMYHTEDLTLFTSRFPLPIFRTMNLQKFDNQFWRRIMYRGASVDSGELQQRFPNNHWSVDRPFGNAAEALSYLAAKYKTAILNGSKGSIGVSVHTYVDPLAPSGDVENPGPGIPIDCWLGSPETPKEALSLADYWSPAHTYLNSGSEPPDLEITWAMRQFHDADFFAKSYYGSSTLLNNTTSVDSEAEMPWGYHSTLRPLATPARPNLRWLMEQTASEKPWNFRHLVIHPNAPGRKMSFPHSAEFSTVYNPQAYWGSFVKYERTLEDDLEDKISPQDFMDAIKTYSIMKFDATGGYENELWQADLAYPASNPTITTNTLSMPTVESFPLASNAILDDLTKATEAAGEGRGYALGQLQKHLWVCLTPRVVSDDADASWCWPSFVSEDILNPMTDLDANIAEYRKGLTFRFGFKYKFYMILTNRVDTEDPFDVLTTDDS